MSYERPTCKDVRRMFVILSELAGWKTDGKVCTEEWDGTHFLTEWSPGDGRTRYAIAIGCGTSGEGHSHFETWLGAREATTAIRAAIAALRSTS